MNPWPSSRLHSTRLDNGLDLHLLRCDDAPVVTTALTYRAGAFDEPDGRSGLAHFLEHMMFRGCERFGSGEIDRRTRRLGGSNNAFTAHDATTYYFSFGAEQWPVALEIEADRLRGLSLDAADVETERSVILEELAMCEAEPWDALERAVQSRLFGVHPYGRPIIGLEEEVRAITAEDLASFHRTRYRPDNATLVVAGAVGDSCLERVSERFAEIRPEGAPGRSRDMPAGPTRRERVVVERGGLARLLFAFPVPAADHQDCAALRLLCSLLATGRSSLLGERLVERDGLCAWISAGLGETRLGGALQIAAELDPGSESDRVEARVLDVLAGLREETVGEGALRRAVRLLQADWVFAHERIEAQALTLSHAAALFGPQYPAAQLAALTALDPERIRDAAQRYLDPDKGSVLGWAGRETGAEAR